MPRSKRNKVVSLTKTGSKGRELKSKLVEELREALDEYKGVYLLTFENMRTSKFKDVRMDFRESRIFMGKNSIAQIAFGRTPEEEYKDNLRHFCDRLSGSVGLLFTNRDKKEVLKYFKNFNSPEFAKAGHVPTENITVNPGPQPFPVSMVDELRKLGMVVEVEDSVVYLREPIIIAQAGSPLTPEQAKVLVKLDRKLVNFKITVECYWQNGSFTEVK